MLIHLGTRTVATAVIVAAGFVIVPPPAQASSEDCGPGELWPVPAILAFHEGVHGPDPAFALAHRYLGDVHLMAYARKAVVLRVQRCVFAIDSSTEEILAVPTVVGSPVPHGVEDAVEVVPPATAEQAGEAAHHLDRAIERYRRAVWLDGDASEAWFALGWALQERGAPHADVILAYRSAVEAAWREYEQSLLPRPPSIEPVTSEFRGVPVDAGNTQAIVFSSGKKFPTYARHLSQMLDPIRDRAEIDMLDARLARFGATLP